ncbi:MAG: PAS domain S-box protein [Thermodesulfobacteriota bacterium]|nr:PAS domain S-box protein [Thermodesulfobacteriota bacterium]
MQNEKRPLLYSLRSKLFITFIIIILIPMTIATFYAIRSLENNTKREIKDKLRADLNTSLYIYEKYMAKVENLVRFASMDNTVKVTLELNIKAQLADYLFHLQRENNLDILTVMDSKGVVFAKGMESNSASYNLSDNTIVNVALKGKTICGTHLVSMKWSGLKDEKLKTQIPGDAENMEIMMIVAANPILMGREIIGAVLAGIKLNGNTQIVEEIKEKRGIEVSLFQGEQIVSTTIKNKEEMYALSKDLSYKMKEKDWTQKRMSILNLSTGNEKYLGAYHPLNCINKTQVGGIAVVSSTQEMASIKRSTANNMLIISIGGILLAMIFATFISYSISSPIHHTIKAMSTTDNGELPETIKVKSKDEVGRLATAFNEMIISLKRSREEIERWNRELEARVNERTRELTESERKYRMLIEQSFYGIFIMQDNTFKFVNEEFQKISGYTIDELNDMDSLSLVSPEHRELLIERGQRRLQGEEFPEPFEFNAIKKDGAIINVEIESRTIDYYGSPAIQCIVRDITEKKRMEQQQLELQEEILNKSKLSAIGLLVQGIAHNMNSPLTGIRGRAELMGMRGKRLRENLLQLSRERNIKELDKRLSEIDQNIKDVETIIGRVDELAGIIKNMTNKGRQEQDECMQLLNITELLRAELQFLEADTSFKHNIKKVYDFDESLPYINGVYSDFSQSFVNIIHNAIDAMYNSEKKELTITTRHDEKKIYVDIHDTGCGINKKDKPKIFDPFFTTKHANASDGPTGTGLGLHSTYTLLKKYNPNFKIKSNKGDTTFTIEIPYS